MCKGRPTPVDPTEPENIATAAQQLGLRHTVITSVTRDDLPDGGAAHFAECIRALKERMPDSTVEVLIPDFCGSLAALQTVMDARPEIINHNIETVPRLYPTVRPMAKYERSLELLERVKRLGGGIYSKTGIMVGLGETEGYVTDLIAVGCILTIGQYLQQPRAHRDCRVHPPGPVRKYRRSGLLYTASLRSLQRHRRHEGIDEAHDLLKVRQHGRE